MEPLTAHDNAQHYQKLIELRQAINCLGLIILNATGQVQLITPQAVEYLQRYFTNATDADKLPDHLWAWVRHQQSSDALTRLPLHIEQADKRLTIRFMIEQPGRYLLLLEEQTLSLLHSLELLGLSQRETQVLALLIRGKDNRAIALQLGVHRSTVRKHLESIYQKLGVQSRTEAIAQALEKLGILSLLPMASAD